MIFRHEDGNKIASPEQIQVWMKQTMDWIGGYVIVKAGSVEEAVEFAKGSPVLQGDGNTVEVRKIAKGDGTIGIKFS